MVVVDLNECDEKALNIALNSSHIAGEFTADLQALLDAIRPTTRYSLPSFGSQSCSERAPRVIGRSERRPALPSKPKSSKGDLYLLGRHRLVCGDSTDAGVVEAACGGLRVDLMLTDPPYGVDYVEKTSYLEKRGIGKASHRDIASDTGEDPRAWFARFLRVVPWAEHATFYIFMSSLHIHDLRLALDDTGLTWQLPSSGIRTRRCCRERTITMAPSSLRWDSPADDQLGRTDFTVYGLGAASPVLRRLQAQQRA